jgi:hypothetical protein
MEVDRRRLKSKAGTPIGAVHPHLRSAYRDMNFISPEKGGIDAELVILALPTLRRLRQPKKGFLPDRSGGPSATSGSAA